MVASGKTPGSDDLPCEFYKVFWHDLAEILLNALNFSFVTGQLSISQRRGIVKLIPKKDAELVLIKNWRPLTLLNCIKSHCKSYQNFSSKRLNRLS